MLLSQANVMCRALLEVTRHRMTRERTWYPIREEVGKWVSGWLKTADKLAASPSSQVTKAAWFISWTFEPDRLHSAPSLTGGPASYLTSLSLGFLSWL